MSRFVLLAWLGLACGPGPSSGPVPSRLSVATDAAQGLAVELWADAPLEVGLNPLRYRVLVDGVATNAAQLTQLIQPAQGPAAPQVGPATSADESGRFLGYVVLVSPGEWSVSLQVVTQGRSSTLRFDGLMVAASERLKTVEVGGRPQLVSLWLEGGRARMGRNPTTVSVHQQEAGQWVTAEGVSLTTRPEMPRMGHGSSGNQDPTPTGHGVAIGLVNFAMSGDWVVHLNVTARDGATAGPLDFAFSL